MNETVLAIDIGGSKIAAALIEAGRIHERRRTATPPGAGVEALIEGVVEVARGWTERSSIVAIATAGLPKDGRLDAVNRDIFRITAPAPFQAPIEERLSRPVVLLNDGHAAAWGEYRLGAGQGVASMVFMTISTGIGGGIVQDGRLLRGRQGVAGHLGFILADPAGPMCGSGKVGTLEAVASGRALESQAGIPVPELIARAEAGDAAADALLDRAAAHVARALSDLVNILDPDIAVIGGGVGLAPGHLGRIERAMAAFPERFRLPLVPAALGADAGLLGVADWAALSRR